MLTHREFTPVGFDLSFRAFGLRQRSSRLVGHLLTKYSEEINDTEDLTQDSSYVYSRDNFQLLFPKIGLLEVSDTGVKFKAELPSDSPIYLQDFPEALKWASKLLYEITTFQKVPIDGVNFRIYWVLENESSQLQLLQHLGLERILSGLLIKEGDFCIEQASDVILDGFSPSTCDFRLSVLSESGSTNAIAVQLRYWSPSASMDDLDIEYTPEVVYDFLTKSILKMKQQLEGYFPSEESK